MILDDKFAKYNAAEPVSSGIALEKLSLGKLDLGKYPHLSINYPA